ncbi:MAG TPA: hypothetical protein VMT54_16665 [Candidatus Cybelea sp.]|nr:hypothetical protein [Candidatus Cybelea sp.]
MMKMIADRAERMRREARELFTRDRAKETEVVKEREKAFAAQTEKTDRLRALRLAREAEERAAAAAAGPAPKLKKTRKATGQA